MAHATNLHPPQPAVTALCCAVLWQLFNSTCVVRCLSMTEGLVAPCVLGLLVLGSRKVSSIDPTVASPTCKSTMPLSKPKSTTCSSSSASGSSRDSSDSSRGCVGQALPRFSSSTLPPTLGPTAELPRTNCLYLSVPPLPSLAPPPPHTRPKHPHTPVPVCRAVGTSRPAS